MARSALAFVTHWFQLCLRFAWHVGQSGSQGPQRQSTRALARASISLFEIVGVASDGVSRDV